MTSNPLFVPPAAEGLPLAALDSATEGADRLDARALTPYGRNFLAHALVQLARDGWLRPEPGEGFEPVRDRETPEPETAPPARSDAALRDRIADTVRAMADEHPTNAAWVQDCHTIADRLQGDAPAVFPEPPSRAAVLLWAADKLDESERLRDLTDDHMHDVHAAANELRRLAAEAQQQPETEAGPVSLATPCVHCGHPYNWHASRGACEFGNEVNRCGCRAFAPGEKPAPVDPRTILGIDAPVEPAGFVNPQTGTGYATGGNWPAPAPVQPAAADSEETLLPPEGPEYTPCECGHIEPEHEPNAGACYSCDCEAYQPTPPAPLRRSKDDCPGFPERCPNLRPVDPSPPVHLGGIRCGCADRPAEPPV